MGPDTTRSDDALPPTCDLRSGDATRTSLEAGTAAAASRVTLPASIGQYRILRLLGEGGMGAVYEAEQQKPRRTVALKVIKAGLASPHTIRRFQQESEALARLHHPGIAQVYEAGTAETGFGPQPFFAMELICGKTLTDYAAASQLSIRAKLELLAKVCDAVHHAHQRGIIHRDLKPANILVEENGQPRVLDFGVARVMDSDVQATRQTDVGQLIGTLAYMSPEQVLADPYGLDTRTDIYSLGVILYELLSGCSPYEFRSRLLHEAVQTIRETDPRPLSSMHRAYRGDIETIVAKALEKDKGRRYDSAADLASDIRRYLHDEPIVARRASTAYQLRKFARRHRALVAGVAAVILVLLAGVTASTLEAIRATRAETVAMAQMDRAMQAEAGMRRELDRAMSAEHAAASERDRAMFAEQSASRERDRVVAEKQRADTEADTARAISDFLQNDLLAQADSEVQAGGDFRPDPDIKVRTVVDRAAAQIGQRFSGKPAVEAAIEATVGRTYRRLGLLSEAQKHDQSALELRRRTLGPDHPDTLAAATQLGETLNQQGKYADAESLLVPAVAAYGGAGRAQIAGRLKAMDTLITALIYRAKYREAEALLSDALTLADRALAPADPTMLSLLLGRASLEFRRGRLTEAEPPLVRALAIRRATLGPDHPATLAIMNNLGVLYQSLGRRQEAEQLLTERLTRVRRVLGPNHIETLNAMNNLGVLYAALGRDAEAEQLYEGALAGWRRQLGEAHPKTLTLMNNLGVLYAGQGKLAQAEAILDQTFTLRRKTFGPDHPDTLLAGLRLAEVYRLKQDHAAASKLLREVLEARRRVSGAAHQETAVVASVLATVLLDTGETAEAETLAQESFRVLREKAPGTYRLARVEAVLGRALARTGRFEEAEALLLPAYKHLEEKAAGSFDASTVAAAREWIRQMYISWSKPDKAAGWRQAGR